MIPGALERVHDDVMRRGWALSNSVALGLPAEADVIASLSPALAPDPRGQGKLHARDVASYEWDWSHGNVGVVKIGGCESIAHVDGTDDFSRFDLRADIAARVLMMVPPSLRRTSGRMSADYFRYSPGAGSAAHQDGFGDLVAIWTLGRNGGGAESFLTTLDGRDLTRGPLAAGSVLVFRDELFLHGVTPLASGHRDALIFITLKDGA